MSWGPSPEYADWWYVVSWKGIIWAGVATAMATGAVVLFTALQFWSDAVRDRQAAERERQANERISQLNNETERLKGDNLALQTVLQPRSVGLIGINEQPKAKEWFVGIEAFAGTEVAIQFAPDLEAQNLANEIAMVLSRFGWKPRFVAEDRTRVRRIMEGVSVSYPIGKSWNEAEPNQPWFAWAKAAEALADALTKAGLGIGERRVSRYGFDNRAPEEPFVGTTPFFDPPLTGVYVQVGVGPVASTVDWIKQGRPDALGNKPAGSVEAKWPTTPPPK